MARKSSKKTSSTSTGKRPPNPTANAIVAECEKEFNRGLRKKRASAAARRHLRKNFKAAVKRQLKKGDWAKDKKKVKHQAWKCGLVAAALEDTKTVKLWAAERAYEAIQKDPACPAPPGGGKWCAP